MRILNLLEKMKNSLLFLLTAFAISLSSCSTDTPAVRDLQSRTKMRLDLKSNNKGFRIANPKEQGVSATRI
jgi:hypothetical protein